MSRATTPPPLSAKDPSSFAYPTMKDRIPVILSTVIDHLTRNKISIIKEYGGEAAHEELKALIGAVSELRYEVMTNKPAKPLRDSNADSSLWNAQLEKQLKLQQEARENCGGREGEESMRWFDSAWLWMECYLYRRVQEAVFMCNLLKDLDVFSYQKKEAFQNSYKPMSQLTTYLLEVTDKFKGAVPEADIKVHFMEFLQMSLWGNKCDLSISAGQVNTHNHNPMEQLTALKHRLLIDDTDMAYDILQRASETKGQPARVDIVLDNAGFELVTDLCLAEYLISAKLASQVVFHAKTIPWFVSDVTLQDWNWTLKAMSSMNHIATSWLHQQCKSRLESKEWIIETDPLWTLPCTYNEMQSDSPDLYTNLSHSDLIIFKGDLNYRKLVADRQWDTTSGFERALRGFHPAPLCSLRTLKSDVVVGLQPKQANAAEAEDPNWMTNGNWAVISVCSRKD